MKAIQNTYVKLKAKAKFEDENSRLKRLKEEYQKEKQEEPSQHSKEKVWKKNWSQGDLNPHHETFLQISLMPLPTRPPVQHIIFRIYCPS